MGALFCVGVLGEWGLERLGGQRKKLALGLGTSPV